MSRTSIANTLKSERKKAGLSIETVCRQLNSYGIDLSKNSLYNYESGYRQPDADTLMALCEIYNIDDILYAFGYKREQMIIEKSPSAKDSAPEEENISLEESNQLLVALGFINEGQQLSDDDFAFLRNILGLLDTWFGKHQ